MRHPALGRAATAVSHGRLFVPVLLRGAVPGAMVEAQASGAPYVASDVIAPESDMIPDLVSRVGLKDSPAVWADAVVSARKRGRMPCQEAAEFSSQSMFDMKTNLAGLERIYAVE